MQETYFQEDPRVKTIIEQIGVEFKDKQFSDIYDDQGHQYIDLVMQGGGVLGYGLIGYLYAIENAQLRVLGVAGTSIGAIMALFIAAQKGYENEKSSTIIDLLAELDITYFTDGNQRAKVFLKQLITNSNRLNMIWNGSILMNELFSNLGLNPGTALDDWLKKCIKEMGISTYKQLKNQRNTYPELRTREGRLLHKDEILSPLSIIAADLTTQTKVVFPEMSPLYWDKPEMNNPANFVRASMSIPFIFHPYTIKNLPKNEIAQKMWHSHTHYQGPVPKKVIFSDGGIISNFPINIFHNRDRIPLKPTFGAKLETKKNRPNHINSPFKYVRAIFNTSRNALDNEFINNNREYNKLITYIDTGKHNWLNFNMKQHEKSDLFYRGVLAAYKFLQGFDWKEYKDIRIKNIQ